MNQTIAHIAVAVLVALSPSLSLANCEPPEGGNRIGIQEDSKTHINEPAPGGGVAGQGGLAGNPAAPGATPAGGGQTPAPGGDNTNRGGTVTSVSKETPTVTGTKQAGANGEEVYTNGGTTINANPATTIANGTTTSTAGQGVEGGTIRSITGTIKIEGATITVKKDPATGDVTVVAVGGTSTFKGGSNLDGAPVPVDPATGAAANAVIFQPFEERPSLTGTYNPPTAGR